MATSGVEAELEKIRDEENSVEDKVESIEQKIKDLNQKQNELEEIVREGESPQKEAELEKQVEDKEEKVIQEINSLAEELMSVIDKVEQVESEEQGLEKKSKQEVQESLDILRSLDNHFDEALANKKYGQVTENDLNNLERAIREARDATQYQYSYQKALGLLAEDLEVAEEELGEIETETQQVEKETQEEEKTVKAIGKQAKKQKDKEAFQEAKEDDEEANKEQSQEKKIEEMEQKIEEKLDEANNFLVDMLEHSEQMYGQFEEDEEIIAHIGRELIKLKDYYEGNDNSMASRIEQVDNEVKKSHEYIHDAMRESKKNLQKAEKMEQKI
jgi:chromosome segregation ATPase